MARNPYLGITPGSVNRLGKQDKTLRRLESSVGKSSKDGPYDKIKLSVKEDSSPKILAGLEHGPMVGVVYEVIGRDITSNDSAVVTNYFTLGTGASITKATTEDKENLSKEGFIKVKVWIPELHQCHAIPNFIKKYEVGNPTVQLSEREKYVDLEIMKSYPVCTAKKSELDSEPTVGSLVKVSFTSRDFTAGTLEKVIEVAPDIFDEILSGMITTSTRQTFDVNSTAEDINLNLRVPEISPDARAIYDSLIPAGTAGPGKQLVILYGGKLTGKRMVFRPAVKNDALLAFIQMLVDYATTGPSERLVIMSAYRNLMEDYTLGRLKDAFGLVSSNKTFEYNYWDGSQFAVVSGDVETLFKGTDTRIMASSQKTLRILNCFPKGYMVSGGSGDVHSYTLDQWKNLTVNERLVIFESKSETVQTDILKNIPSSGCTPQTAPIRTTGVSTSHENGTAFDIQVYPNVLNRNKFPKEGRATVPITGRYQWLLENCWKYGFKRTVFSERWHFEYRPESKYYSGGLPHRHPTFDGSGQKST